MNDELPVINIRAHTNKHALFLISLGMVVFFIVLLISQFYWREYQSILIFCHLTTFIITLSGIVKRLEPHFSFTLSPEKIIYHHRYGQWQLDWHQIKRVAIVKETVGLETIELPYIGIRLSNIELLTKQISPRLANRLLHEQKTLMSFAILHNLMSFSEGIIHFEPYKLSNKESISGPLAAFLYHCRTLESAFGYHLFLPETSIDRDITSFCTLLMQCKNSSSDYLDNSS